MHKNKINIFTFQIAYIKKILFYFTKFVLISLTSKKYSKTLEKIMLKNTLHLT